MSVMEEIIVNPLNIALNINHTLLEVVELDGFDLYIISNERDIGKGRYRLCLREAVPGGRRLTYVNTGVGVDPYLVISKMLTMDHERIASLIDSNLKSVECVDGRIWFNKRYAIA